MWDPCAYSVALLLLLQILSTFGDLCLVLGDKFEKYLDTVKAMLTQAMGLSIQQVGCQPAVAAPAEQRPLLWPTPGQA